MGCYVIGANDNIVIIKVVFSFKGNSPDIDNDKPVGPYPIWVKQSNTNRKVPVVQAYQFAKYLGELWLEFDEAGEVVNSYGNPILLDSSIGQGILYIFYYVIKYIFKCIQLMWRWK